MKIWFQNRRYKTKRKLTQQHEIAVLNATKRVPVQVLVREDGSYGHMVLGNGEHMQYSPTIDPALFNMYRNQVNVGTCEQGTPFFSYSGPNKSIELFVCG